MADDELSKTDLRRLEDLHAGNVTRETELAHQGVQLDPVSILALQIQALKDTLLGDDEAAKLDYELAYQTRLAAAFEQIAGELIRAKLTAPPAGSALHLLDRNGHG